LSLYLIQGAMSKLSLPDTRVLLCEKFHTVVLSRRFLFKAEAGVKAVKAGNEARQDWGRGSHPEAKARQTETEVWKTERRGKQKVGPTRCDQT